MLHYINAEDFKKDLVEEIRNRLLGKELAEIRFTEDYCIWAIVDLDEFHKDLRKVTSVTIEIPGDDILDELDPKHHCFGIVEHLVDEALFEAIDWFDGVNSSYSTDEDEELYYFVERYDTEDDYGDDYDDDYDDYVPDDY